MTEIQQHYQQNKLAPSGQKVKCPCCPRRFPKSNRVHIFCQNSCRMAYYALPENGGRTQRKFYQRHRSQPAEQLQKAEAALATLLALVPDFPAKYFRAPVNYLQEEIRICKKQLVAQNKPGQ